MLRWKIKSKAERTAYMQETELLESPVVSETNTRAAILQEAEELINGDRAQTYGPPEISFGRIADIWNAQGYRHMVPTYIPESGDVVYVAEKLDAVDASLILIGMKLSRTTGNRQHKDNWVDMAGYSGLGAELAMPNPTPATPHFVWSEEFKCYVCGIDNVHMDENTVNHHVQISHPLARGYNVDGGPLDISQ